MTARRGLIGAATAGAVGAIAIAYSRFLRTPCDDAFIFLVYAKNFVDGHGLTFNGVHVEGYTSPLWMWTLAVLGLTRAPLPALASALSTLSGLAALVAAYVLARRTTGSAVVACLPPLLLALCADFAYYMGSGMEQLLFATCVTVCALMAIDERRRPVALVPIVLAITILVRPEGVLVAAVVLASRWWRGLRASRVAFEAACLAVMIAPFLLARHAAYGQWLPNTYYVKSTVSAQGLVAGLRYIVRARFRYGPLVVMIAGLAVWAAAARRRVWRRIAPLAALCGVWVAQVTIQGGDSLVGGRLWLPVLPVACVILATLLAEVARGRRARGVLAVAAAALVAIGYPLDRGMQDAIAGERQTVAIHRAVADFLRTHFPPSTLVALNAAGMIPYYSELPALDMLGLNDPHIAHDGHRDPSLPFGHQLGDSAYVLARQPGVILFGTNPQIEPGPYVSDRGLWASAAFHDEYHLVEWPGIGWAWIR